MKAVFVFNILESQEINYPQNQKTAITVINFTYNIIGHTQNSDLITMTNFNNIFLILFPI